MEIQTDSLPNYFPFFPITLDRLSLGGDRNIYVIRDDLLPGGSKQRAVIPLLQDLKRQGIRKVCYASPFAGFAQVALAQGCKEVGLSCRIFAERDQTQENRRAHAYTQLAAQHGAQVQLVDDLTTAETMSLAAAQNGYQKIPLGFQCESFQNHFESALKQAWGEIRALLGKDLQRIWLPVGSSTLARTFLKVINKSVELHCVDVHVLLAADARLSRLKAYPQIRWHSAPQDFKELAEELPPLPSNLHYDAKLWRILRYEAQDGDLWWNVAR